MDSHKAPWECSFGKEDKNKCKPGNIPKTDKEYFETMVLCILQAGLSWSMVRRMWPKLRQSFYEFDINTLSNKKLKDILSRPNSIKNLKKTKAIIKNAKIFKEIKGEYVSFRDYLASLKQMSDKKAIKALAKKFNHFGEYSAEYFLHSVGYWRQQTMKAAVFYKPFDLRIEDIETPQPRKGEVLIRVKAASICGTDLHIYQGKVDVKTPIVLGHDGSGVIEKIGKNVSNFKKGDRVIPSIVFSCQKCSFCKIGKRNLCEDGKYIGFETNGVFAEYLIAPANCVFKIPKNVSFEAAAIVEPIELALHTLELIQPKSGETITILGQGPIGLVFTQIAKNFGLKVIAIEKNSDKLFLAKSLGADFVINPAKENLNAKILEITKRGADYTVEAVGTQKTIDQTTQITKPIGKIAIIGEGKDLRGPLLNHTLEQVIFTPVSGSGWDYQGALKLLAKKKINTKRIITHRIKLENISGIFTELAKGKVKPVKIIISF